MEKALTFNTTLRCYHCAENCGELYPHPTIDSRHFCCKGCRQVSMLLESFADAGPSPLLARKQKVSEGKFEHLEGLDVLGRFPIENGVYVIPIFLNNIFCLSCIDFLEKLPLIDSSILWSRFNLSEQKLVLGVNKEANLASHFELLEALGLSPFLIESTEKEKELLKNEQRNWLVKLGIAGAVAGNTMLFAISNYAGAGEEFRWYFDLWSALIFLPVLFFSMSSFFAKSWKMALAGKVNLDTPIAVALLVGSLISYWDFIFGEGHLIFFDSLSTLSFLLLATRYWSLRNEQKYLRDIYISSNYNVKMVEVEEEGHKKQRIPIYQIKANNLVKVEKGMSVPVDGIIQRGETLIDESLLTGESVGKRKRSGDEVIQGSNNLEQDIVIRAEREFSDSYLECLIKRSKEKSLPKFSSHQLKLVGEWYSVVIALASISTFLYWSMNGNLKQALITALTVLIVTCPCALGIVVPLSLTQMTAWLSRRDIFLREPSVLFQLPLIKNIFLDKTGTLTSSKMKVLELKILHPISDLYPLVIALEKNISHPVAKALYAFASEKTDADIQLDSREIIHGKGVRGEYQQKNYRLEKSTDFFAKNGLNSISLKEDEKVIAVFYLQDEIIPGTKEAVQKLKEFGLDIAILSGDKQTNVDLIADKLDIKNAFGELTPEDKVKLIQKKTHTLMVGDGANDAAAIKESQVGISASGSMEFILSVADGRLLRPGLSTLIKLLNGAEILKKSINLGLAFNITYNFISLILAVTGVITPLLAAILMPLSALTVLSSTYFFMNRELKKQEMTA